MKAIYKSPLCQINNNRPRINSGVFAGVFLCLHFLLASAVAAEGDEEPERTLIGYSSELTVRPGDTIEFMVNAKQGGNYKADLARVINGESQTIYGDQFQLEYTPSSFEDTYKGARQELNLGSYVHVQNTGAFDQLQSFTVSGWIYPVFDPTGFVPPDLENPDPFHPPSLTMAPEILDDPQTIVSRFDASTQTGWALRLNPKMQLEFAVGNGTSDLKVVTISEKVQDWGWSYVGAAYDAKTGMLSVHLQEKPYSPGDQLTARTLSAKADVGGIPQAGPLRIAAVRNGPGAARATWEKPGHNFNGRIQDIRISDKALDAKSISAMAAPVVPDNLKASVVVDYDFSREISSTKIMDVSSSGAHGVAVNLPNRAVRGRFWAGEAIKWTERPDLYDAITFYADDIYDAQWSSDFSFTIPDKLKSGVYAARLTQGDFVEYITFFVAAPKGKPSSRLAFWASDYNYLAYVGISLGVTAKKNYPSHNWNEPDLDFLRENPEYAVGGMYDTHVDGRNFGYGTRLRPDIGMKPGALTYNFPADTHVTAFLEHFGYDYDVITDELVDEEGLELLEQYDVIISSTHPEYTTIGMVNAIKDYSANGGRFMYVGGNGYFWSVGQHSELPGVMESRNFFEIPDRYLSNGQRGGLIIETGLSTGPVVGVECSAMIFNGSSAYRRLPDSENPRSAWIFERTTEGPVFGDYGIDRVHGAAAGFEIDKFNPGNGVPRHALNLATSEPLKEKIEEVKMSSAPISIHYTPASPADHGQADMVFFETPKGGAVFSTGSITWMSSTPEKNYDNDVAKITSNVLKRFLDPKPFVDLDQREVKDYSRLPPNPEYEHADQQ
jgi:N,N-dimethylformamidase